MKYGVMWLAVLAFVLPAHAKETKVGWALNTGVAVPLVSPLADVATVGPSVGGEALYSVYDWISVGVGLTISIPVPIEVAGETAPVPHFVTILARTMFHGGDRFTYFGALGVGLSYYGIPECESRCQESESVARFGGDVTVGVGGRINETLSIGPSVTFVVPDFIRGDNLWFLTGNLTMQWGL